MSSVQDLAEPGPRGTRRESASSRLRRLGFVDATRAQNLLEDKDLVDVLGAVGPTSPLVGAVGGAADPDLALLALVRLCSTVRGTPWSERLAALVGEPGPGLTRAAAVLGASAALGDEIIRHPELVDVLADLTPGIGVDAGEVRAELLHAVGADQDAAVPVASMPVDAATDAMRRAYRSRLLRVAASDLTSPEPLSILPAVGAALADLAAASLEAGLAIARAGIEGNGLEVRLAVLGMGKCGGRELNYVSDVDVIYVAEPADGVEESVAMRVGARLVTGLTRACSAPSSEPPLWPVDAALRPEGKDGPIVRTLTSHRAYYERWAKTWEFQALLKARTVAGDRELGRAYLDAVGPMVWQAVTRENFVSDSQAMRRRVEDHVPAAEADRQLKLGKGGLRDVEFTVQLLQLVHGRTDETIRSAHTLTALAALTAGGYVARDDAARMSVAYRFLRVLEHRIQMFRLERTHLLPTDEADLRRLARAAGMRDEGAAGLLDRWKETRRDVRSMHEALYYRPLLPAVAQLSRAEASLSPENQQARLAAIGYRDPRGAVRHIAALTEGVSRRAAIQRQLLPVLLGWFGEGADPDSALLAFRRLSETLGTTHWYLKMLRDSGSAAQRLARLLSSSRFAADALALSPESVSWLADDAELVPLGAERLRREVDAMLTRSDDVEQATQLLRALRRRELARTAVGEVLSISDPVRAAEAISAVTDATLEGALRITEAAVRRERGIVEVPARLAIVAMGRLGGREPGYGSDADVMFVHRVAPGATDADAGTYSLAVASRLRSLLGDMGPEPGLQVDADLRPEGRQGPLVRSIDSYAEYYQRWSEVWEAQALLRARTVAGDEALCADMTALIDTVRYPAELTTVQVREVRRIKARVESERMPRGVDPTRHVKLGRGGISDVEWTVQLLQLQHAHEIPALRTTSTLEALDALAEAGLVTEADAVVLREAWVLASGIRNAVVLWSGRVGGAHGDMLPSDRLDLAGVSRTLDYPAGAASALEEDYLRASRRCRQVVERVFYES